MPGSWIRRQQLVVLLSILLVAGFALTSVVSYAVSLAGVRRHITTSVLPLTSDGIYAEIKRDLLAPIHISAVMAGDTFLRDWMLAGEQDPERVVKYLKEIKERSQALTAFLVSDATSNYYYAGGILKQVSPEEERDIWYYRVRRMATPYELNIDPDLANRDTLTVFINHRVMDYDGNFLGAVGVGLGTNAVAKLVEHYQQKYGREIFLVDRDGSVVPLGGGETEGSLSVRDIPGLGDLADDILSGEPVTERYTRNGTTVHVNARFVRELNWFLVVCQPESRELGAINNTLLLNLLISALIALVALIITRITVDAYERQGRRQQEHILRQHDDLLAKNAELEHALATVRKLSGLLPICASCKKVRDDHGYWQQIELYLREHSEAEFSHGICPDCAHRLYPNLKRKEGAEAKPSESSPPPVDPSRP